MQGSIGDSYQANLEALAFILWCQKSLSEWFENLVNLHLINELGLTSPPPRVDNVPFSNICEVPEDFVWKSSFDPNCLMMTMQWFNLSTRSCSTHSADKNKKSRFLARLPWKLELEMSMLKSWKPAGFRTFWLRHRLLSFRRNILPISLFQSRTWNFGERETENFSSERCQSCE